MNNPDSLNTDLILYYKERAKEYKKIYDKPERQNDLLLAERILQDSFAHKTVIEIACGTGYWTEKIAKTAHSILAIDINATVLEVAQSKNYSPATVAFQQADLFKLTSAVRPKSLFGGFIWSHVKKQDLPEFIDTVNRLVNDSGTFVFMDNEYVDGSSTPISETDKWGNTYQVRQLENGTTHKVLKNFPTETAIRHLLADKGRDIDVINLPYYWILKYTAN